MAMRKKTNGGRAKKVRTMPAKSAGTGKKRGRPKKTPAVPKLTDEQKAVLPNGLLDAANGGDVTAAEQIRRIVSAHARVVAAEANKKEVSLNCKNRKEQERTAFESTIEASRRENSTKEELDRRLCDIQSKYQDYKEAELQNAIERKEATADLRDAKKALDEAITNTEQLALNFESGKTIAVANDGTEKEIAREEVGASNETEKEEVSDNEDDEIDLDDEDEDEDEDEFDDDDLP